MCSPTTSYHNHDVLYGEEICYTGYLDYSAYIVTLVGVREVLVPLLGISLEYFQSSSSLSDTPNLSNLLPKMVNAMQLARIGRSLVTKCLTLCHT